MGWGFSSQIIAFSPSLVEDTIFLSHPNHSKIRQYTCFLSLWCFKWAIPSSLQAILQSVGPLRDDEEGEGRSEGANFRCYQLCRWTNKFRVSLGIRQEMVGVCFSSIVLAEEANSACTSRGQHVQRQGLSVWLWPSGFLKFAPTGGRGNLCAVWLENHTAVLINIQVSLCWQGLLETPASANYSYKPTLQLSLV